MSGLTSPQQKLQRQIEVNAHAALSAWESAGWNEEPGTDSDEGPLKYIALILLEAIEEKAIRITMDKDSEPTVYGDVTYTLPKAPSSYIARGLEILREIAGMEGSHARGSIVLGVRNDSIELILQKDGGRHTLTMPGLGLTG